MLLKALALLLGFAIAVVGVIGVVSPEAMSSLSREFATPVGLVIAAALRLILGLVLLAVARATRSPTAFRVIGLIALLGGLVTPLIGVERARSYVDWFSAQQTVVVRLWGLSALLLGGFIFYAVWTGRRALERPATTQAG
jgi:hypothetical protein